ncbi:hypothetical protein M758_1G058200 [Ceratodon purpureus]|uniref:Uncharacterized protein n=1 Tax=Ceratodon purpureus TaxID=3225 RepID=A0A8T0J323_CERPU|nr:hypothetical protein KC19_1G059700 [Ceratodon purpureus]KAG0589956.1 hypothetical protein KC19_1G059700 [Ceratodon purpureus]KAG0628869.1 hypothetical protein M758_1G058200 [Ceratodon purpureus]KAG0628870.1 hypothetical protein M758_1G058200 [Ceratodon purpureus]KAG0628871.1 hypothetical protein M758_1G058200 [Ceratodon purpureus]
MATVGERANIGYDQARMEGKGPVGGAMDAAKAAAGRGGPANGVDYPSGMAHRGTDYDNGVAHHGGMLGRTEEELARLQNRTVVTGESEPYAPNPNIRDLPKEFETRVQVIQRYPEMKTVEKTDFVKEVRNEERVVTVPKTRVVMDEVERVDRVPVVKQVPKTRIEQVHRVVTEDREVTEMVPVVEYENVPRVEQVPRIITEEVQERVTVPVVVEVPVTRMVEVPTGNYCEAPVEEIVNPGHAHHMAPGALHRTGSSSSSSSSDDEHGMRNEVPVEHINADGTTSVTPGKPKKKRGLLNKILHH